MLFYYIVIIYLIIVHSPEHSTANKNALSPLYLK